MSISHIHNLKQQVHRSSVVWKGLKRHTAYQTNSWFCLVMMGGSIVWAIPKWCDRTPKTGPIKAIWLTHTQPTPGPKNADTQPRHETCYAKGNGQNDIPIRVILIASLTVPINGEWLHHYENPQVPKLKVVVVPHSTLEKSSNSAPFLYRLFPFVSIDSMKIQWFGSLVVQIPSPSHHRIANLWGIPTQLDKTWGFFQWNVQMLSYDDIHRLIGRDHESTMGGLYIIYHLLHFVCVPSVLFIRIHAILREKKTGKYS